MKKAPVQLLIFCISIFVVYWQTGKAQITNVDSISKVWVSDNGDGTYKNPILYADYSDPDVIRVGDTFYMTSSSFNCIPALPILQSFDLVNWTIIGSVFMYQKPLNIFKVPQHGKGVWAPSMRYHNNEFYIYYGDPDYGIYVTKSRHAAGPWTEPVLIKAVKGWIDPCPFWDDDGNTYLVHAWAGSRAGIKSILTLNKMDTTGYHILDQGVMIFDGHLSQPTIEGPKIYKRKDYYYIFAPAGGVKTGWQTILRSKNIYGPYEEKVVLHQGNSPINGPHQGAWVDTEKGESWFIHFQDLDTYGRIVHLQPVQWVNDWPMIGIDKNNDSIGEPVLKYKKPDIGRVYPVTYPQTSDEFNSCEIGPQWQWQANPIENWGFSNGNLGYMRLNAIPFPDSSINMWNVPNLFLQKLSSPEYRATLKVSFKPNYNGEKTGLIIMGTDYAYLGIKRTKDKLYVLQTTCLNADQNGLETQNDSRRVYSGNLYLRVKVDTGAICNFSYSTDGTIFVDIGKPFIAKPGKWISAKVGMFCISNRKIDDSGFADFDWFRIE